MSKRPRTADPRQPDLFGASPPDEAPTAGLADEGCEADASEEPGTMPIPEPPAPPEVRDAAGHDATPDTPDADRPMTPGAATKDAPVPDPPASTRGAPAAVEPADEEGVDHGPRFRRVDPSAFRGTDRPDRYLYTVASRKIGDDITRYGIDASDHPMLVERGGVPRLLAAVADELSHLDDPSLLIDVLRVRRDEIDAVRNKAGSGPLRPAQGRGRAG